MEISKQHGRVRSSSGLLSLFDCSFRNPLPRVDSDALSFCCELSRKASARLVLRLTFAIGAVYLYARWLTRHHTRMFIYLSLGCVTRSISRYFHGGNVRTTLHPLRCSRPRINSIFYFRLRTFLYILTASSSWISSHRTSLPPKAIGIRKIYIYFFFYCRECI